jgi:hypothetical protein
MQQNITVRELSHKVAELRFKVHRFRLLREKRNSLKENMKYLHKKYEQSKRVSVVLKDKFNNVIQRRADIFESFQFTPTPDALNTVDYIIQIDYGLMDRFTEEQEMLQNYKDLQTEVILLNCYLEEIQENLKTWIDENEDVCQSSGIPFSLDQCQRYLNEYKEEASAGAI